jgi:hypothetical protein
MVDDGPLWMACFRSCETARPSTDARSGRRRDATVGEVRQIAPGVEMRSDFVDDGPSEYFSSASSACAGRLRLPGTSTMSREPRRPGSGPCSRGRPSSPRAWWGLVRRIKNRPSVKRLQEIAPPGDTATLWSGYANRPSDRELGKEGIPVSGRPILVTRNEA